MKQTPKLGTDFPTVTKSNFFRLNLEQLFPHPSTTPPPPQSLDTTYSTHQQLTGDTVCSSVIKLNKPPVRWIFVMTWQYCSAFWLCVLCMCVCVCVLFCVFVCVWVCFLDADVLKLKNKNSLNDVNAVQRGHSGLCLIPTRGDKHTDDH